MDFTGSTYRNGTPRLVDGNGRPFDYTDTTKEAHGIYLPHISTFIAQYQGGLHNYWMEKFDEALKHARSDAQSMARDCWLMSLVEERKRAVASLKWHLEVPDEKDKRQTRVRDGITKLVKSIPNLYRIVSWLLDALWYGRSAVQVEWQWMRFSETKGQKTQATPGRFNRPGGHTGDGPTYKGLTIGQAWPINGDKIGHRFDHTPFILLYSPDADKIPNAKIVNTNIGGQAMLLEGDWRERFIFHRHLMEDMDYFQGDQAEAVHGVGIRSKVFWMDFLKREWLANITNFFSRVGLGMTLWKYPRGNAQALEEAKTQAKNQSERAHIFVPVDPDNNKGSGSGVERIEVPTSGAEALLKLIEYTDRNIERYIVGQSASASGANTGGFGNEAAVDLQANTKLQITLQDANWLGVSLSGTHREPSLLNTIQRYTYPWADFPVTWHFDVEKQESEKKLQAIKSLVEMGLKVKADEARSAGGLSKPMEGDEIVHPPTAIGAPGAPGAEGGLPGMPGNPSGSPAEAGGEKMGGGSSGEENGSPEGNGDFLQALQNMREHLEEVIQHSREPVADPAVAEETALSQETFARLVEAAIVLRQRGRDDLADAMVEAYQRRAVS